MLLLFTVIVLVMLVPQFGFLWFIDKEGANGAPMLLPMIALAMLGNMYFKAPAFRFSIIVASVCLLAMTHLRGFFWHPFERGEGFWTLNRLSGFSLLAVAFLSFEGYRRLAKRFGW